MEKKQRLKLKNTLFPCIFLSAVCGAFTGVFIFGFKFLASRVIEFSSTVYAFVRENPSYLPILLGVVGLLACASYFLIKYEPDCKGGGIPTVVAFIRGFISFRWLASAFVLLFSALITFLGGVPLGNEGPSVQMGCAVGRGTVDIFSKKNKAWDKYIMTGGACAGFAAVTGAPISAMLFAIEEIHHRFSPLIFMAASTATLTASVVMRALGVIFGRDVSLFHFEIGSVLPMRYVWATALVGIITGLVAILYTKLYRALNKVINGKLKDFPLILKFVIVFIVVGLLGFLSDGFIGTGHGLIDLIIENHYFPWLVLLLYLLVRAVMLLVANQSGITGGLFVPSLCFGAIVGELVSRLLIFSGILPAEYRVIMVVVGMASFLSAASRIPLVAVMFSVEALSSLPNIVTVAVGVAFSYLVVELSGIKDFSETVVEKKIAQNEKGRPMYVCDVHMTVKENAFAVGKEVKDILWPPRLVITSVYRQAVDEAMFQIGDVLHLRYKSAYPEDTYEVLESFLGKQDADIEKSFSLSSDEHYNILEV